MQLQQFDVHRHRRGLMSWLCGGLSLAVFDDEVNEREAITERYENVCMSPEAFDLVPDVDELVFRKRDDNRTSPISEPYGQWLIGHPPSDSLHHSTRC